MAKVAKKRPLRTRRGDVLTDQEINALAAEAEAGYDLSKARWMSVGRPALGHQRGESPRIGFRATRDLYKAAHRRAKAEGKTVSSLAREAMERYLGG